MDSWIVPHSVIAYFALMMAICSLWIKRTPWFWGTLLLIAFFFAFYTHILTPIALLPIIALLLLHSMLKGDVHGGIRFILVTITFAISLGLFLHLFPGFHNLHILKNVQISTGAPPVNLYLNFDKPFIGFFVLVWAFPLLTRWAQYKDLFKFALPAIFLGIILLASLAISTHQIAWDPKLPSCFALFAIENLILVCIPEEAFMRGFVQNEFTRAFGGRTVLANVGAVIITSLLFTALHYKWVPSLPFLALVFVAGIIYGGIYQYTRSIEASILCHWLFNITHFLLFTYPVLM